MRAASLLLALLGLAGAARARGLDELGRLEREAAEEALAARGLTVDPAPDGKVIGAVHVVTLEVFSRRDPLAARLAWANMFHRTTREYVLRREALFRPGDRYDPALVEETTRNLQNPALTSVVVILPVVAPTAGTVDVLIVTRDVWSLRLNTDFEVQEGALILFSASISENNVLGLRKSVALVFDMNQGTMAAGPTYVDRNIAGTRLTLTGYARALFRREDGQAEGSTAGATLAYPLYALSRRWGGSFEVGHGDYVARRFLGTRLRRVDLAETPEVEALPWIYRVRSFGTSAAVVRSFPGAVIQRVSLGHQYSVVRPSFTADFPEDEAARAAFAARVFPRSERVSALVAGYSLFTPRYRVYRDLDTFDLREDYRLGPTAGLRLSRALRPLGSEVEPWGIGVSAGWAAALGGGFQRVSAGWSARVEGGRMTDKGFSAGLYGATPVLAGVVRLLGSLAAGVVLDDTQNALYALGGTTGLRGYTIGDLVGRSHFLGHLEARSMPLRVYSLRVGGVLFYDVGDAATPEVEASGDLARAVRSVLALTPHHDVGFGLRLLIPQFDAYVLRFDWAFATVATENTRPGWPGRMSLGFRQVF